MFIDASLLTKPFASEERYISSGCAVILETFRSYGTQIIFFESAAINIRLAEMSDKL
jgi:hypothetical protein